MFALAYIGSKVSSVLDVVTSFSDSGCLNFTSVGDSVLNPNLTLSKFCNFVFAFTVT